MKIILKENIENLGSKGDIVNVAAGYGRNYLLPKKLALEVTSTNMKMIEIEQASLKKNLEKSRMSFQDVIQRLNAVSLSFERKTGEKDTIFGSVSVADIKEKLDKLSFEIEKKKILLKEPIKRLGNYTVPIKVFLDDIAEIKIEVVPEGGEEEDVKPVIDKAKEEKKAKKVKIETAPEEGTKEAVSEKHEEEPKEKVEIVESKEKAETKIQKEKKDEVVEDEKIEATAESETEEGVIELAGDEEIPKSEEKEAGNEKNKTSK